MLQRAKKKKPQTPLQKLKNSQLPKRKTIPKLRAEADMWFSREVRLRDSEFKDGEWVGECITCQRRVTVIFADGRWNKTANLGHYIGRGKMILRYDPYNCNMQCARCNAWMDKHEMLDRYRKGLILKYGDDCPLDLEMQAPLEHKLTRGELEQVIADAKEFVSYTLAHPNGL